MKALKNENNKIVGKKHKCFRVFVFSCFSCFRVFVFSCFCVFVFLSFGSGKAAHSPDALAGTSPDAIAIRVIPNPEHYSALHWYQEQGWAGSPQSLTVDGYEAVRDGRTVYVNAANVIGNNLYTNIYLISYNQDAEQATADIFSQILNHWKFNTNITGIGDCSISSIPCLSQDDCSDNYVCGSSQDKCILENPINCLIDSDCPNNLFCNSSKAKIIRDTYRMADLVEMKIALEDYQENNGHYPKLSSGTYLAHKTISVWTSWQETMANELGIGALPIDPINALGKCCPESADNCNHYYDYDIYTCWDKTNKSFAGSIYDNMPSGSRIYVYDTDSGISYVLCAQMETSHIYDNIIEFNCFEDEVPNNPPEITGVNLPNGSSGEFYEGHISASDPDGDSLSWSIDTSATVWTMWSAPPVIGSTLIENQKAIKADYAGADGSYGFTVTVDDNRGGVVTENYSIIITNMPPVVAMIFDNNVRVGHDYYNTITATDINGHNIVSYTFSGLPTGITSNSTTGVISGISTVAGSYNITVTAIDEYGAESEPVDFILNVNNYCGDDEAQDPNMESVSEECDDGAGNTDTPCMPGYGLSCEYCDTGCYLRTVISDEYCGDDSINGPEECDDGAGNTDVPCSPAYNSSCDYCDTSCSPHEVQGAFCGDGNIDVPDEQCDQNETDIDAIKNALEAVQPGITSGSLDPEITVMYQNACTRDCAFGCLINIDELGQGCYLGACQKGKLACADDHITLVCENVFNTFGHPDYLGENFYDYCCDGNGAELQDGNVLGIDFAVLYARDYIGSGSFYCDDICRMEGKICVGIGLSNPAQDSCIQIVHDIGNDCSLGVNQTINNCTAAYVTGSSQCVDREGEYFQVGEAACYCF